MPVTNGGKEVVKVPYIYYPVRFQEDQEQVNALLDSGSKANAISLAYVKRLSLKAQKTDVWAQKINGSAFETFGMVIADFQVEDKVGKPRFF